MPDSAPRGEASPRADTGDESGPPGTAYASRSIFDGEADLAAGMASRTSLDSRSLPITDSLPNNSRSSNSGARPSPALPAAEKPADPPLLSSFDLQGVTDYIKRKRITKVVCMCGAGISVAAGISDFRTPGTGLYDNLQKYKLPRPQAVFELDFFRQNPEPFYQLAQELFPGRFLPTRTHYFIKLLHDKGLLLRCYTQNIDSLETLAGVPAEKVIAAHGNFDSATCISCEAPAALEDVKECALAGKVCHCKECNGLVKPDIVFFGEHLPSRFFMHKARDLAEAELLIIMGTSLVVHPFASLIDDVSADCPRLLINREVVGVVPQEMHELGYNSGLWFEDGNRRDAKYIGDCDEGVAQLADMLGWRDSYAATLREREAVGLHTGAVSISDSAPADAAKLAQVDAEGRAIDGSHASTEAYEDAKDGEPERQAMKARRHVFAVGSGSARGSDSALGSSSAHGSGSAHGSTGGRGKEADPDVNAAVDALQQVQLGPAQRKDAGV